MTRAWPALALAVDFLWHVVTAGLTTAWWIVRRGPRLHPVVIALPYTGLSRTGVVIYGCLLSLTPGTTTIDVDVSTRTLRLHLLDGHRADATAEEVRRRFETRLQRVFPEVAS
jgi:multicomponent K+:H+ antiporter subunit E/multicomponent Na+:H+ antiporter subunit E